MVTAFDLGQPLLWFTYLAIILIVGQLFLYLPSRQSRFGLFAVMFILMLGAFLAAELIHLRDLLRVPQQDELLFMIATHVGLALFAASMHFLEEFSKQVGSATQTFGAAIAVQEALCPVCRRVRLKVPLSKLVEWKLVTARGTLAEGVTLQQLVDRGFAIHPPHRKHE